MASDLRISARLFTKKRCVAQMEAGCAPRTEQQQPSAADDGLSSAAKKQRRYRERLKADPEKHKVFKQKNRERMTAAREKMTPAEKARLLEMSRVRVQRCRAKKKEEGLPLNKPKLMTRATREVEREKARARKRKSRDNMTPQKRAAINKKQRDARAMKKANALLTAAGSMPTESLPSTTSGYNTKSAKRKAVQKTLQSMPHSPSKFAQVISSLASVKSPNKAKALANLGFYSAEKRKEMEHAASLVQQMKQHYASIKHSRSKVHRKDRVIFGKILATTIKGVKGQFSRVRKEFGISWSFLYNCVSNRSEKDVQERKGSFTAAEKKTITDFFERGDISRPEPSAAAVSSKTGTVRRYMEVTVQEAYRQFKADHSDIQISFSRFAKFKPKNTKTARWNKMRCCICEYCANIDLKIAGVNSFLAKKNRRDLMVGPSKYDLANMTICNKPMNETGHCVARKCQDCGTGALRSKLQEILDDHADEMCSWQAWQLEAQTFTNKAGKEQTSSKRLLRLKSGPFDQLVTELEEALDPFANHLANSQWQHRQFATLKQNLPPNWLLFCMDFAENMTCAYQDEVQGAHWARQQITIHPVVAYYRCPDDDEVITESIVFVSPDLKHDSHAVQRFQLHATDLLHQRGLQFSRIVHFSDGCPGQYKGKTNFVDLSFAQDDTGIVTEKHFFGTRHGKGPCDAEIGVIKRVATLAVRRRRALIADAQDLYRFGKTALTRPAQHQVHCHNRRTFIYIDKGEICRERPDRVGSHIKAVKGSRALHAFRGLFPYAVTHRERSCFCSFCVQPRPDSSCDNEEFCGPWEVSQLDKKTRGGETVEAAAAASVVGDVGIDVQGAAGDSHVEGRVLGANGRRVRGAKRKRGHPVPKRCFTLARGLSRRRGRKIPSRRTLRFGPVLSDDSAEEASEATTSQHQQHFDNPVGVSIPDHIQEPLAPDDLGEAPGLNNPITVASDPNYTVKAAACSDADVLQKRRSLDSPMDAVYAVNSCVVVRYPDRCYPGVVVEDNLTSLRVDFLKPHGTKENVFTKPAVPDVQTVMKEMIVAMNIVLVPCGNSFREWRVEGFSF